MPAPGPPEPSSHALQELMPFTKMLGVTFGASTRDEVRARLEWTPELCTSDGLMHGGVIMTLADSTAAACALFNVPDGAGTTTIESKTNFLRGVRSGQIEARSRPLHVGRSIVVIETDVRDAQEHLIARVTQTQMLFGL